MLELLDSGRMAHKFGKWRGAVAIGVALTFYLLSYAVLNLGQALQSSSLFKASQEGLPPLFWGAAAIAILGFIIQLIGSWALYRDHVHGDYYIAAEHYRKHGW